MSGDSRLSARFGADTSDFKNGVTAINREIKVLETGFRASASQLGDWSKNATGLESRITALNGKIGLQKEKVDALTVAYERDVEAHGKSSVAAQNALITLNNETEALGKMETELKGSQTALDGLGKESINAGSNVAGLAKEEQNAEQKTVSFKDAMGGLVEGVKIAATAIAGVALAVVGVGVSIVKLVLDSAAAADELVELSDKTGLTTDRLQELEYIGKNVGTELETITGSQAKLIRSMSTASGAVDDYNRKLVEAKEANKNMAEVQADLDASLNPTLAAFNQLGISVRNQDGSLRDQNVVFAETIDALGKIQNPAERDALAMQLFGKSAQELNPLIKAGSAEMARLSTEAHTMGAVMSGENVQALGDLQDTLDSLKLGLQGTLGTLAGTFAPGFQAVFDQVGGYLKTFSQIVSGSGGDVGKMADGMGKLVGQIATDVAAQMPKLLTAGLNILQGIVNAIVVNLPKLLPAVVAMLTSLVTFITQVLPILMQAGVQLIMALVNGILPQLPTLVTAALGIIITLANGITSALPQLMPVIAAVIPQIILALVQTLPLLINAAAQLILALANGLVVAIPILLPYIPKIIDAIVMALVTSLPILGKAAVSLINALRDGIFANLPLIGKTAGEIIGSLTKGIAALVLQLWQVGNDIVKGIWDGIVAKKDWFYGQIGAFFTGIVDGVKSSLGINSPSTVFAEIGAGMVEGLGVGFTSQFKNFKNLVNQSLSGFQGGDLAFAGAAGGMYQRNTTNTYYYGPVTIQGESGQAFTDLQAGRF